MTCVAVQRGLRAAITRRSTTVEYVSVILRAGAREFNSGGYYQVDW